jgi:glycosyltransferase involved in cell wall biosynthesis
LSSGVNTQLVLVGNRAWNADQELRLLNEGNTIYHSSDQKKFENKRSIIRIEYVPFPLLVSLIRGAKFTIFPSIYEGFGLPILESMILGTPVLSARVSSIPEVAGDAACLIDPYDTQAITEAIRALDIEDGLRATLTEKGFKRAALFDEKAYQSRLSDLYRRVSGKNSSINTKVH